LGAKTQIDELLNMHKQIILRQPKSLILFVQAALSSNSNKVGTLKNKSFSSRYKRMEETLYDG